MPAIGKGLLERLKLIDNAYGDCRYHPEQELRLYVWFHEHLFSELSQIGGVETGYVFRQRGELTLLVYKAKFDGTQRVVFVTASTPVLCMKILCRKFYADELKWVDDKYA